MFIAKNFSEFKYLFAESLRAMLSPKEPGALILVLANSLQDEELRNQLKVDVQVTFDEIKKNIDKNIITPTDDDMAVLKALDEFGVGSLCCWETKSVNGWEMIFNPVRSLRPARASAEKIEVINRAFNDQLFNFNKPFLSPEIMWEDEWEDVQMRVLYNKFPFAPYHLIIVPEPEQQYAQYLSYEHHELIWELVQEQHDVFHGFGAGYNSLGACASVNHLHFQGFIRKERLPVEEHHWHHNGGKETYPMHCTRFSSVDDSWKLIQQYHKQNQPYNLLYRHDRCYVLPRIPQGTPTVLPMVQGAGWIEECGVFNVSDRSELQSTTADDLTNCLKSLSVE